MTKISTNQISGEDNSRIDSQLYEYEEAVHITVALLQLQDAEEVPRYFPCGCQSAHFLEKRILLPVTGLVHFDLSQ